MRKKNISSFPKRTLSFDIAARKKWKQALVREGLKNIAAGANPIILRKGMKKAKEAAVAEVKEKKASTGLAV